MQIYGTSGSYFLDTDEWEGHKGKVTWERVGFGPDNIYAQIEGNYLVKFDIAEHNIDTVLFTNKDFLLNAIEYQKDEKGSIEARSKDVKLRLMDTARAESEKTLWQLVNIVLPILFLLVFGFLYHFWRKRKFAEV